MNETSYYITRPGGTPTGPYTLDSLEQMAADGKLEPDFLYCVEGMPEWLPITRIVDLPGTSASLPPLPTVPSGRLSRIVGQSVVDYGYCADYCSCGHGHLCGQRPVPLF